MTTPDKINKLLDNAPTEEAILHKGLSVIVSYLINDKFTVDGRAGLVDITKFDINIARKICREDAFKQLYKLEAYKDSQNN